MRFSRRLLLENNKRSVVGPGTSRSVDTAHESNHARPVVTASQTIAKESLRLTKLREKRKDNDDPDQSQDVSLEVADVGSPIGGGNTTISDIATRTYLTPVLSEVVPDFDNQLSIPHRIMYEIYRDMYYHDAIAGAAVDIISSLAFSDFNLVGLDDKQLEPFLRTVSNLKMRRLGPQVSVEYNVNGSYIAQTPWDKDKKNFKNLIPHNPAFSTIYPSPIFGRDPTVMVDFASALKEAGNISKKRNGVENIDTMKDVDPEMLKANYKIPEDELIFMTRRGLHRDLRGVSYYRRILPVWLFEKALIRGTLDQSTKRQRAIAHIQAGDETWQPSAEEMTMLAQMYNNADLDPVGAVFITTQGVNVNDIRRGDDFWKWNDMAEWAATQKMKGLGINEGLLSGDLTLNTLDMSLSVFIEQIRDHRDTITYEMFYERTFPRIAVENDIRLKKDQAKYFAETANLGDDDFGNKLFEITSYETANFQVDSFDPRKHAMPRLAWHKRLRPEADSAYLEVLTVLEEKGLPLPLQMWASAGGLDLRQLTNEASMEQDGKLRERIKEWKKEFGANPEEEGVEEGSLKPIGLLKRDYGELVERYGPRNLTSDGKRKLMTPKGKKILLEKIQKSIAEAAVQVGQRENAKLKSAQANIETGKSFSYNKSSAKNGKAKT